MDTNFSPAGFVLIGMALGLILGGLSTYGFLFAWAIKSGREWDEKDERDY